MKKFHINLGGRPLCGQSSTKLISKDDPILTDFPSRVCKICLLHRDKEERPSFSRHLVFRDIHIVMDINPEVIARVACEPVRVIDREGKTHTLASGRIHTLTQVKSNGTFVLQFKEGNQTYETLVSYLLPDDLQITHMGDKFELISVCLKENKE